MASIGGGSSQAHLQDTQSNPRRSENAASLNKLLIQSYGSILYRKMALDFLHIILRGVKVDHHDIVIHCNEHIYEPTAHPDQNASATLILGFVEDAEHHIDIQGFNVYHKNRLIKVYKLATHWLCSEARSKKICARLLIKPTSKLRQLRSRSNGRTMKPQRENEHHISMSCCCNFNLGGLSKLKLESLRFFYA